MKTKYPNFMAISLGIIVAEMLALVLYQFYRIMPK